MSDFLCHVKARGFKPARRRGRWTHDPIAEDRALWRAQSFRQLVHILPSQTVLQIGTDAGPLTRQLLRMTRGECPITLIAASSDDLPVQLQGNVEVVSLDSLPQSLAGRRFDFIIGTGLLGDGEAALILQGLYDLLKDGGQVVLFERNPWSPMRGALQLMSACLGIRREQGLQRRSGLYELLSDLGFVRNFAVYNDFVYAPLALTQSSSWLFRNLSVLLERAPCLRQFSSSILLHAQKPPRDPERPRVSLFEHESLRGAVSVVIPCRNEEMNIGPLIRGLKDYFEPYLHEIIAVDDNSSDRTRQVLKELSANDPLVRPIYRTPPNGVGRALADGYRAATGEYVLSMDCDFQHLLPEVRDIFDAAAQGYDVVVGSRFSRHSVLLNYPFQKIVANRAFHLLAQLVLMRRFRDLTNNLKLIRRDIVQKMLVNQPGFAVNAETGLQPLLMGCQVKEVPISWINRTAGMGVSSFKLVKVGGGYGQVLYHLWLRQLLNTGPYRSLPLLGTTRQTWRDAGIPRPALGKTF